MYSKSEYIKAALIAASTLIIALSAEGIADILCSITF